MRVQAMLYVAAIMRLGESTAMPHPPDDDSLERMVACLRVLSSWDSAADEVWLNSCRHSFAQMIADKQQREAAELQQLVRAHAYRSCNLTSVCVAAN